MSDRGNIVIHETRGGVVYIGTKYLGYRIHHVLQDALRAARLEVPREEGTAIDWGFDGWIAGLVVEHMEPSWVSTYEVNNDRPRLHVYFADRRVELVAEELLRDDSRVQKVIGAWTFEAFCDLDLAKADEVDDLAPDYEAPWP